MPTEIEEDIYECDSCGQRYPALDLALSCEEYHENSYWDKISTEDNK